MQVQVLPGVGGSCGLASVGRPEAHLQGLCTSLGAIQLHLEAEIYFQEQRAPKGSFHSLAFHSLEHSLLLAFLRG